MTDFDVLVFIRDHLLNAQIVPRVYLALPPQAQYPFILIDLEESWSQGGGPGRKGLTRLKFKVSIQTKSPGIEEVTLLSDKVKEALEGRILRILGKGVAVFRLIGCEMEGVDKGSNELRSRCLHQSYESIIRKG